MNYAQPITDCPCVGNPQGKALRHDGKRRSRPRSCPGVYVRPVNRVARLLVRDLDVVVAKAHVREIERYAAYLVAQGVHLALRSDGLHTFKDGEMVSVQASAHLDIQVNGTPVCRRVRDC